jgi:hypothetical protein
MSSKQERERQSAAAAPDPAATAGFSASRRDWLEATAPVRPRLEYLPDLRSWAMVGSGRWQSGPFAIRAFYALDQTRLRSLEHLAHGKTPAAPDIAL